MLPGDANNYLVAIAISDSSTARESTLAGIAYADITTGEFAASEFSLETMRAELIRLHPAEILHTDDLPLNNNLPGHSTPWPAWRFEPGRCEEAILTHFQAATLDGFGLKGQSLAIRAAGAILQYLKETQADSLKLLTGLHSYSLTEFMTLDAATRRNLELTETLRGERKGSLLGTLDYTVTPMGKRLMHQWVSQPLLGVEKINKRLDGVDFFFECGMERAELRIALKPLADIERLTNRIIAGHAQPRDMVALRDTLERIPAIHDILEPLGQSEALPLQHLNPCEQDLFLLQSSIDEEPPATLQNTGIIRPGYSDELDGVIEASKHARDWIANLEATERKRTGIKTLKVGYNKVFGYYIEISRGAANQAPEDYIRKQTLVNAERFITPEMKEFETLVLNAEERIREIELRLFREICATLGKSVSKLLGTARALAELDVLSTLAEVAALGGYNRPEVREDALLDIREGRHPVVEQSLRSERYVPNDVTFEKGEIVRVITGPNMSGKSTYLRQVALIVLMAQMGSFVPASTAKIGMARDITHKSEAGGVILNLQNERAVIDAYDRIMRDARAARSEARIEGVTVQPMHQRPDFELLIGSKMDRDFGPVILFGMGGILTEVIQDRAIGLPPLNRLLARRLMEQTRVYRSLQGYRNIPAADLAMLEEILIRLAQLVTDFAEIEELDINPLFVNGKDACAIDARVLLRPSQTRSPLHLVISPYPDQFEEHTRTSVGIDIFVRPIRPEDAPLLVGLFESLSPRSVYLRFFSPMKRLPHSMLALFTQIDYDRHIALVAMSESKEEMLVC